ncbi:3',5'-nucleoside bisphosphate phosphatase [Uliginosibacterium sp. sgz301328]|uniref:3',5'-nucleoside bisphosphate phosphatase n=1 Tax=Uliginosibacterium sp. sgz301328 TaxID=3243764 RepID=UPI00359EC0D0
MKTPLNADLHCHSTFSDGLMSPTAVVERAANNGVDLLALTDHDELAGLPEAREAARATGVAFVDGVEISISWLDQSVHIVGLAVDPASAMLAAGLAAVREGRDTRARRIGDELARIGIEGAYEGAASYAENPSLIGRAHFARYLVSIGVARDTQQVFDNYLVRGKPGFVDHEWATLDQAVEWIHNAGGLAVVAHPGRYRFSKAEMSGLFERFAELGGDGVEVVTSSHTRAQVLEYARVARRYGFLASRASDFHGPGESQFDLGRGPSLPPDLTPVWERLPVS